MGVRRTPVRRRLAAIVSSALVMAAFAVAQATPSEWLRALPDAPDAVGASSVPWYDALDASASVRLASDASVALDVSLRWRMDARTYLARAADDARDLALHAQALATRTWQFDQLGYVAQRCEASWRSAQADLIDRFLQEPGAPNDALTTTELRLMRALLERASPTPLDANRVRVCRLDALLVTLDLAADHPQLVLDAVERRLGERSARSLSAPPPPSLWLRTDLDRNALGVRANVRVGIDVPLPTTLGVSELTLASDGRVSEASVRWLHAAGSGAREPPAARVTPAPDTGAALAATLSERRLQASVRRVDASRRWTHACGADDAGAIVTCMRGPAFDVSHLDALLTAVDAELVVLQTTLAAIEASGHALVRLLEGR